MTTANLDIRVDSSHVRTATTDLNNLASTARHTERSTQTLGSSFAQTARETFGLGSALKGLAAGLSAMALFSAAKNIVGLADQMTLLDSRIKIATSSQQDYINSSKELVAISMRTGTAFDANATIFSRINKAMEGMGGTAKHTTALTETLAQTMRISGAGAQEAASTIRQLSQAMASGVLRGDEFNSIMENAPRLSQALADGLHVSIGALRAMAMAGELTSKRVIEAIQSQGKVVDDEFAKIPLTVGAAMTNISTAFGQYILAADKGKGATAGLAQGFNLLAQNITPVVDGIVTLGKVTAAVFAVQIVGSIGTYISTKAAAIAVEKAHGLAIAENTQRAVASASATVARMNVQLSYIRAQMATVQAEKAGLQATVASSQAEMNAARATLIATDAMIQNTSIIYIRQQALAKMTAASATATAAETQLAAAQARLAVLSGQVALSMQGQTAATAALAGAQGGATVATTSWAASLTLASVAMGLLNAAMGIFIGWQIGTWLNTFTVTQNLATIAIGHFVKLMESANYVKEKAMLLANGELAAARALTVEHKAAMQGYDDLTRSIVASNEAGEQVVELTGDQKSMLESLRTPQQVFIDDTKQLGMLFNSGAISLEAYNIGLNRMREAFDQANAAAANAKLSDAGKEIVKLQDKYDKLTMSVEDYNKKHASLTEGTDEERVKMAALANSVDALEASKKELTKTTKDYAAEAKKAAKEEADFQEKAIGFLNGQGEQLRLLKLTGKERELETKISSDLNSVLGELYDSTKVYTEAKAFLIAEVMNNTMAIFAETEAQKAQTAGIEAGKSAMESEIDRYQKLTMSANEYLYTKLLLQGVSPGQAVEVVAQFSENNGIEEQQKAIEESRKAMDSYNESVGKTKDSMGDLGKVSSAVFDGALGGISAMAGAFANMTDTIGELNDKIAEQIKKRDEFANMPVGSLADIQARDKAIENSLESEMDLNRKKDMATLAGTRQVAGAMSKMFAENTKGRQAFHAIEKTLAIIEMAMSMKKIGIELWGMATTLAANLGTVAPTVVAETAKATAGATTGIVNQAQGDPYSAFPRMAAMAGIMAALVGVTFAMGSGGSSASSTPVNPYEPTDAGKGIGTVLGDPAAVSESLTNTYDLLKDIHADEYRELRGINDGVNGLVNGIQNTVSKLFQGGYVAAKLTSSAGASSGSGGGMSAGLGMFGSMFGGSTKTTDIVGAGVRIGTAIMGDVLDGMSMYGEEYITKQYTKTSSGFFGIGGKTKTWFGEEAKALSEDMQQAFGDIFRLSGKEMLAYADVFGVDLTDKIREYKIPDLRVDLAGLTGKEIEEKITGVVSAALDTMTGAVFGEIIGEYQNFGEGLMETALRLVTQLGVIRESFSLTGKSIQGDAIKITDGLAKLTGGIEEFQSKFEDAWEEFATEPEKQTRREGALNMKAEGIFSEDEMKTLLSGREGFRELSVAIGDVTEANMDQAAYLLNNKNVLVDYYSTDEKLLKEQQDAWAKAEADARKDAEDADKIAKQYRSMEIQLMGLQGLTYKALTEKRKDELEAMDSSLVKIAKQIHAQEDANKTRDLENALLTAQGNTLEVVARQRALELKGLSDTDAAIKQQIYDIEDLTKTRELENKLLMLQGNQSQVLVATRERELLALSATDAGIQKAIWGLEDLNAVLISTGDAPKLSPYDSDLVKASGVETREQWNDLANGIDSSTEAGQWLLVTMQRIKPAFEASAKAAEDAIKMFRTPEQAQSALGNKLADALSPLFDMSELTFMAKGGSKAVIEMYNWLLASGEEGKEKIEALNANHPDIKAFTDFVDGLIKAGEDLDKAAFEIFATPKQKQTRLGDTLHTELSALFSNETIMLLASGRDAAIAYRNSLGDVNGAHKDEIELLNKLAPEIDRYLAYNEAILKQRHTMEITLLEAQGKASEALAIKRQMELDAMDESLRPLQLLINAQLDLNKLKGLEVELLTAQGKTHEALILSRELELVGLTDTEKAIKKLVNAEKDLAAAREKSMAAMAKSASLDIELLNAQGNEIGATELERAGTLQAMDDAIAMAVTDLANAVDMLARIQAGEEVDTRSEQQMLIDATLNLTTAIVDLTANIGKVGQAAQADSSGGSSNTGNTGNTGAGGGSATGAAVEAAGYLVETITSPLNSMEDLIAEALDSVNTRIDNANTWTTNLFDGADTVNGLNLNDMLINPANDRSYNILTNGTQREQEQLAMSILGITSKVTDAGIVWTQTTHILADATTDAASSLSDYSSVQTTVTDAIDTTNTTASPVNSEALTAAQKTITELENTIDTLNTNKQKQIDIWAAQDAKKIADERKGIQDKIDSLTMNYTELLDKQRGALDESNRALFDELQFILQTNALRGLEIELLNAQGKSHEALIMTRQDELKGLSDAEISMKKLIFATSDLNTVLAAGVATTTTTRGSGSLSEFMSANSITDKLSWTLFANNIDLTTEAGKNLISTMAGLTPEFITYMESVDKAAETLKTNADLQRRLDILQGNLTQTRYDREKELADVTDETTRSLMKQINAQSDYNNLLSVVNKNVNPVDDAQSRLNAAGYGGITSREQLGTRADDLLKLSQSTDTSISDPATLALESLNNFANEFGIFFDNIEETVKTRQGWQDKLDVLSGTKTQKEIDRAAEIAGITDADTLKIIAEYNSRSDAIEEHNKKVDYEIALTSALGLTYQSLLLSRDKELEGLTEAERQNKQTIWGIEDANKTRGLEIELLNLAGAETKALAMSREDELRALSATDQVIKKLIYLLQDLQKAVDIAKEGTSTAMAVLQKAVDAERKSIAAQYDASIKVTQESIDKLTLSTDKLKGLSSALKNFLDNLVIKGQEAFYRAEAQAQLSTALIIAKAGGGVSNPDELIKAIDTVSKPSEELFSTFTDYQRDFLLTANTIRELNGLTDTLLSTDELTLKTLKDTLDINKKWYDAEIDRLDDILENAQAQIDAVNGTTIAVMSVVDAIANLATAIGAQIAAQTNLSNAQVVNGGTGITTPGTTDNGAGSGGFGGGYYDPASWSASTGIAQGTPEAAAALAKSDYNTYGTTWGGNPQQVGFNNRTVNTMGIDLNVLTGATGGAGRLGNVDQLYATAIHLGITSAEIADIYQQMDWGITQADILENAQTYGIPAFAQGINEVPYDMTANIHQGERILPAADNKELMMRLSEPRNSDNKELAAEIRALRAEVASLRSSNEDSARSNRKTADTLERVTRGGEAMQTEAYV